MKLPYLLALAGFFPLALAAAPLKQGGTCPYWELTPEARAYINALKKEISYQPRRAVPALFARSQVKYSLHHSNYLHRWLDRPLHQDTSLSYRAPAGSIVTPAVFKITAADAKLGGMEGISFYPMMSSRRQFFDASRNAGPVMKILSELGNVGSFELEKKLRFKTVKEVMTHPHSFKLDGKVVMTEYSTYSYGAREEPRWAYVEQLRKEIARDYGKDKAVILPYTRAFTFRPKFSEKGGRTDVKHIKMLEERLRKLLRICDGFHLTACTMWVESGRKDATFFKEVVVPVVHKIYSEPEFKGKKYLSLLMDRGHLNMYRWNFFRDSGGTHALRVTLESIEALRPDLAIGSEWDEENENTCFRPTLYNSISTQRILRSFMQKMKKEKYAPIPGDNIKVPNLIFSARQSLAAGELLELEVTNVPDGTFAGEKFRIECRLTDVKGKTVHTFAPHVLDSGKIDAFYFTVPVSKLLKYHTLLPQLKVTWSKGVWKSTKAPLAPIDLRANVNVNYKWILQPLRNIPENISAKLEIAAKNPDGTVKLRGSIKSPKKLRTVEIHDGGDVVFMESLSKEYREDDRYCVFKIAMQSLYPQRGKLHGKLICANAPGARGIPAMGSDKAWVFNRHNASLWTVSRYAVIPRKDLDKAELVVDIPALLPAKRIKFADVYKKNIVGITGRDGMLMTVSRFLSQRSIPAHIMKKEAAFEVLLRPSDPKTTLYTIVAIDEDYNVYRGAALPMFTPRGKLKKIRTFESAAGKAGTAELYEDQMTKLTWKITPERGAVLLSDAGTRYSSVLGGNTPMATNVASGETSYGNTALRVLGKLIPGKTVLAPAYVREKDNSYSLRFTDRAHWNLPMQMLFPYSGFEFKFKVFPEKLKGKQALFTMGHNAFELTLDGAVPRGWFFNGFAWKYSEGRSPSQIRFSGPALKEKAWNEIKVIWDCKTLRMAVNGVPGKAVPCEGNIMHAEYGCFGRIQTGRLSFDGKIADVSVTPL